jgi:ribulose-phosphate 3-epimerase
MTIMKTKKEIISPSLLAADFMQIGNEIRNVTAAGADWIHADVMDGVFVPNITIGNPVVEAIKSVSSVPIDVHLMIVHPENHIQKFIKAGADILTVHCENNANIFYTLMEIRQSGISPAVAINPGTPVTMVEPLLSLVDMVLVMTVNPGFGGQKFIPDSLQKIMQIRKWSDERNLDLRIQVDGGINEKTARQCREAGADVFVAGTSIFKCPQGYAAGIKAIRGSSAAE